MRAAFVPIGARDPAMASAPGHDPAGYLDDVTLRARAEAMGAFLFSRPEDLHADPAKPTQVVFASTGHGTSFPADDWGDLYLIDMEFPADLDGVMAEGGTPIVATLTLLHDSDETGDHGLRNPDNVVWAADGFIYVQEDKAVRLARFGAESGMEASIWRLDPRDPSQPMRIAMIDRGAVPHGMTDPKVAVAGEWESSGIIDLSPLLDTRPGEVVLLATVQAHGVRDGAIGGRGDLVEAGQLLLLWRSP